MKKVIKRLLGRIFYSMGLDVKRHVENQLGLDPRRDMTTLLRAGSPPVIFDVGALYRFVHQDNVASWADSLFVNPEYQKANPALSQAIEHRDSRDRR